MGRAHDETSPKIATLQSSRGSTFDLRANVTMLTTNGGTHLHGRNSGSLTYFEYLRSCRLPMTARRHRRGFSSGCLAEIARMNWFTECGFPRPSRMAAGGHRNLAGGLIRLVDIQSRPQSMLVLVSPTMASKSVAGLGFWMHASQSGEWQCCSYQRLPLAC